MKTITVKDKSFEVFISAETIQQRIGAIAASLNEDLRGKDPFFVVVLNGAFLFAADVFRRMEIPCEIGFIRVSSYSGTSSTGEIRSLMGLSKDIAGRTVVVLEDIVDTGHTAVYLVDELKKQRPAEVRFASLLLKPDALQHPFKPDYTGFEVPNDFLLGYGLDYDGYGRNLNEIYKLSG